MRCFVWPLDGDEAQRRSHTLRIGSEEERQHVQGEEYKLMNCEAFSGCVFVSLPVININAEVGDLCLVFAVWCVY